MNPVMHGHDCASSQKVVSQVQIFILQCKDFISQSQDFISFCFVSQSTISSNSPLFFFFVCHFEFSATVQLFRDSHSLLPVLVTSQVNNQKNLKAIKCFQVHGHREYTKRINYMWENFSSVSLGALSISMKTISRDQWNSILQNFGKEYTPCKVYRNFLPGISVLFGLFIWISQNFQLNGSLSIGPVSIFF